MNAFVNVNYVAIDEEKFLAMPGTLAQVEWGFSQAGKFLRADRCRLLLPKNFENLPVIERIIVVVLQY